MAAVLACGEGAFLTHLSAGALYGICEERPGRIEVGVRRTYLVGSPDLRVRRRPSLPSQDVGTLHRIPVTAPVRTMIDLATEQGPTTLLRSINEADKLEVIHADDLRCELEAYAGQPGVKVLRTLLDRDTFVLKLVVETDGLRYHRTPSAQAKDARRDQAHTAAGYTRLRFSHHQVKYERDYVRQILRHTRSHL